MKHCGIILLTYAALVLETGFLEMFCVDSIRPSLLPLILVVVVVTLDGWPAVVWGAVIGLLADCLTPGRLGIEMFCATVCVLAGKRLCTERTRESTLIVTGLCFLTAFVFTLVPTVIRDLVAGREVDFAALFPAVNGIAAYSAVLGFGLLLVWRTVRRLIPLRQSRDRGRRTSQWTMLAE